MSDRRFTREEAIELLTAAAARGDGGDFDDSFGEVELMAIADEMGIDRGNLRSVLAGGTGRIDVYDQVSAGVLPGNEMYERVIAGEISGGELAEIADFGGSRFEDQGEPGVREVREFWDGFRYVVFEAVTRDGRTRLVARSRTSVMRLTLLIPIVVISFAFLVGVSKRSPGSLPLLLSAYGVGALAAFVLAIVQARRGQRRIRSMMDGVAERVAGIIRVGGGSTMPISEEVRDRLRR